MADEPNFEDLVFKGGAALEAAMQLFRDPRYGTELTSSEYQEVARYVLEGALRG